MLAQHTSRMAPRRSMAAWERVLHVSVCHDADRLEGVEGVAEHEQLDSVLCPVRHHLIPSQVCPMARARAAGFTS